ncbi:ATP-binding protein [Streptomyces sp. NPDC005955]|uniref:ATP-binding protein n=1 Tax=Streptomyces sp. NPDC005955 TaxID=3364738 RepID=UPI0036B0D446
MTEDADHEEPCFDEVEGRQSLSSKLSPQARDLALALRRLMKGSGQSQRQFVAYHDISTAAVSRYLSGERIPRKDFLDWLLKSACKARGVEVSAQARSRLYQLHLDALQTENPARYQEQLAMDRLEDAVMHEGELELERGELRTAVAGERRELRELASQLREVEAAQQRERGLLRVDLERHRARKEELEGACTRLRDKVTHLEKRLREAEQERDGVRVRCKLLEAELAVAQEAAEREERQRQEQQEQRRQAEAAARAGRHREDLESAEREARLVRQAAARQAAAQLEEARARANDLVQEATLRATKVRPTVLKRSTALRQLREAAEEMAEQRLPELAEKLSRAETDDVDGFVRSVGIHSRDDVGQAARALDSVHRASVQMAVDQAVLRRNLNTMLANLSRRCLDLVRRQLTLISALESREADPRQLAALFQLDHLATRMRRNGENLLVLAGEEPGRYWNRPAPLVDVLRAAASEVEQYERIAMWLVPDTEVAARVVNDLVHLLAELLENATSFSSPQTRAKVTGHALSDGRVLIEIDDTGIGLSPEALDAINERLAAPPTVDVSVSRRMGLFVVGRLSQRHGIRVQLRPSVSGGTTALVMLPAGVTRPRGGGSTSRTDPPPPEA